MYITLVKYSAKIDAPIDPIPAGTLLLMSDL